MNTRSIIHTLALILLVASLVGCEATRQARGVKTSGFLDDYSQLEKGESGQALLVYVDDSVDFSTYDKVMIDPIKAYPGVGDSLFRAISEEDLQKLLDYFHAAIRTSLEQDYEIVDEPAPGVMRLRVALTDADPSKVALDVVSSVMPPAIALNALKTVVTGEGAAVGEASMEFEALDAMDNSRLAAAVDKRVGTKYSGQADKFDRWRATKGSIDEWTQKLHDRLAELRDAQK